jgi:hypothetical protein
VELEDDVAVEELVAVCVLDAEEEYELNEVHPQTVTYCCAGSKSIECAQHMTGTSTCRE